MNEAYNTKIHRSGTINIYDGTGIDGLPIRLYLNNNGEILNAHPIL
ncbi:hypothetical protein P6F46_27870 (plasmid) [Bacillus shihchuchen]|uniref:Uncharacterized protein n=1 Tax=Bacillus shihchuchen TaxID=3036942 RepID=A0ABT7KZ35_9BACI|nr:hypothetical protein [Bacillus shihchuchen]